MARQTPQSPLPSDVSDKDVRFSLDERAVMRIVRAPMDDLWNTTKRPDMHACSMKHMWMPAFACS